MDNPTRIINYRVLDVDFSLYSGEPIIIKGDYLQVLEYTGITDLNKIEISINGGRFIPVTVGLPAVTPFEYIQLRNLEGASGKIRLIVGAEYFRTMVYGVVLQQDLAGLAKQHQLPSSLTASGNLRVALVETNIKQPVDVQDHWSENIVLLASGARTTSGNSGDIDVGRFLYGEICIDVTAVSGTNPVLDIYIEGKDRYTGKYKVLFSHIGISSVQTIWDTITMLAFTLIRVRWVISGTSPSFTFSVSGEFKS